MWNWDVALGIGEFLITCALALWGLKLAKWQHKLGFGALVLLGAVLTGCSIYRAVLASDQLNSTLEQLTLAVKHTHLLLTIDGIAVQDASKYHGPANAFIEGQKD